MINLISIRNANLDLSHRCMRHIDRNSASPVAYEVHVRGEPLFPSDGKVKVVQCNDKRLL